MQRESATRSVSSGEVLIEDRLTGKARKDFYAQNKEQFRATPQAAIEIVFKGDFSEKTRASLRKTIQMTVDFLEENRLAPSKRLPQITVHTPFSWFRDRGAEISPKVKLPAAKLIRDENPDRLCLILPPILKKNEEVLNTLRLIVSNISGQLFFDEHVPFRFPFSELAEQRRLSSLNALQYLRIYRFLEFWDADLEAEATNLCKKKGLAPSQFAKLGFAELMRETRSNKRFAQSILPPAKQATKNFEEEFMLDEAKNLLEARKKIMLAANQTGFVLPHEVPPFIELANKKDWKFFYAVEERLGMAVNAFEQLEEIWMELKNGVPERSSEKAQNMLFCLRAEKTSLLKTDLVFPFLKNGPEQTEEEAFLAKQFPLWIYQRVFSQSDSHLKANSINAKKVYRQYESSLFQKLYGFNQTLLALLGEKTGQKDADNQGWLRQASLDYAYLNYVAESIRDVSVVCSYLKELWDFRNADLLPNKTQALIHFRGAWKYALSFIMVHHYYSLMSDSGKLEPQIADKFAKSVLDFLKSAQENSIQYRLASILIHAYRQPGTDVSSFRQLVVNDCPFFDRHILESQALLKNATWESLKQKGIFLSENLNN